MISGSDQTAPHETELKLSVDPADISAFKALPFLAGALMTRRHLAARYFDTDDHALHRAGYSLRLRRSGENCVQTLKGPTLASNGLFVRAEVEREVAGDALDQAMLQSALPPELAAACIGRLAQRFSVTFERTEWLVRRPDGLVVVSADSGVIEAGDEREPLTEVEFELREGPITAVFALAREALATLPLHIQLLAKSDRGYRLLGLETEAVPEAPPLDPGGPVIDGFRVLAGTMLRTVLAGRDSVLATDAVEAVHRLRVALRRLRSLIAFAGETSADLKLAATAATWRKAFRRLGDVRDLDILTMAIPLNAVEADAAVERIAGERRRALEGARHMLCSRGFASAVLELLAFADGATEIADTARSGDVSLQEAAAGVLARRWRLLKRAGKPARLKPRARHRVRVIAKTFRYASDLFGELFVAGKAERRRRKVDASVRALQDVLGRLSDRAGVERLARGHLGRTAAASLGLAPDRHAQGPDLKAADKAYDRLVARKAFWRRTDRPL